jgi:hypothetical protein
MYFCLRPGGPHVGVVVKNSVWGEIPRFYAPFTARLKAVPFQNNRFFRSLYSDALSKPLYAEENCSDME